MNNEACDNIIVLQGPLQAESGSQPGPRNDWTERMRRWVERNKSTFF
jgi:hypothetical protein